MVLENSKEDSVINHPGRIYLSFLPLPNSTTTVRDVSSSTLLQYGGNPKEERLGYKRQVQMMKFIIPQRKVKAKTTHDLAFSAFGASVRAIPAVFVNQKWSKVVTSKPLPEINMKVIDRHRLRVQ